jgi:hypothetical protein
MVLPQCEQIAVLKKGHDDPRHGCHVGFSRTRGNISKAFYIPNKIIKRYCKTCEVCQHLKPKRRDERAEFQSTRVPILEGQFGHTFIVDIVGPEMPRVSKRTGGYRYVLVCVEEMTRFVELIPLTSLKAQNLAAAIESNLIARYACKRLVYDQQRGMMSDLFQGALKILRVSSNVALAGYHSRTAIAERYIRTVEDMLKPYIVENKPNWQRLLPWIYFMLRQTPNATLGYSAHELVFGANFPDALLDLKDEMMGLVDPSERQIKKNVISYLSQLRERISSMRTLTEQHRDKQNEKTSHWFNKQCTAGKVFRSGDKVLILEPTDPRKMYATWTGPGEVVKQLGNRNYVVRLDDERERTFHVNQLRLFHQRTDDVAAVVVCADLALNHEDRHLTVIEDECTDKMDFKIETDLPNHEREGILNLLNEFKDVFRSTLGCTNLVTHKIELSHDKPCVAKTNRIPQALQQALQQPLAEEIDRLLKAGVLRECSSPYRSGLNPILKPDKTLRLVNAFEAINTKTVDDLYPMRNPLDIVTKFAGKRVISKLDLSKSFLQIPLDEGSQAYTAFSTHSHGTLCWQRCALGLKNSPRSMQRLMDSLLRSMPSFCDCLIDDMVVASDSIPDHISHLRTVLTKLREANLTVSLSKSEFVMKSNTVLGSTLEGGCIKPRDKHVHAVLKIGKQTTKAGVRALLGTIGYHRPLINSFAEITYHLTQLLKKDQPDKNIKWLPIHTQALEEIKRILTSRPILAAPRHDLDYILMTDA